MHTITITEPRSACCSVKELEQSSGVPIEVLGRHISPLVDLKRTIQGDEAYLHPGTMVGTLRVGGFRLNVKPRLSHSDMVTLIRYAYGSEFEPTAQSQIDTSLDGLDELLCGVLADELSMIRQRGVSRLYVNKREALTALRGRPDFLGSFPWNDAGATTLMCRYHELSCDNLDNQIIAATLDRAVLLDIRQETRVRLSAHRHAWHELASSPAVSLSEVRKARSVYTRLTEHYRLSHHLCEAILGRLKPRALFERSDLITAGVALDMAELFELAVYRLLRESLEPGGYVVRYQTTDADALRDGIGERYRHVRPDTLIFKDGTPVMVVDAKYKEYWEAEPTTLTPMQRVSNDDIYQLFFYASRLQSAHRLPSPPPAVIISPVPSDEELLGRHIIANRFRTIRLNAGGMTNSLRLTLLPVTAVLRGLASGGRDSLAVEFTSDLSLGGTEFSDA